MVFKNLCFLVLWTKVASALEGLKKKENVLLNMIVFNNLCFLVLWTKVASAMEGLKKKENVLLNMHVRPITRLC